MRAGRHLMIGTAEHVSAKLAELHDVLRFDRVQALADWGGLPAEVVADSLHRLGEEVAPARRGTRDRAGRVTGSVPSWPRRHPQGRLPVRVARGIADDDREARRVDHQTVHRLAHSDLERTITVRAVPHREDR